jgi:hypothetical protein
LKRHKAAQGVTVGEGDILFVSNGAGTANTYARAPGCMPPKIMKQSSGSMDFVRLFWLRKLLLARSNAASLWVLLGLKQGLLL